MADNTTLNTGSGGDVMRTEDRSGIKTEVVGLDLAIGDTAELLMKSVPHDTAFGSSTPLPTGAYARSDANVTDVSEGDMVNVLANLDGVLWANPIRRVVHSSVNITTGFNVGAYVAGDQCGVIQTVSSSAARLSTGGGIIRAITILDDADIMGMMDVVILSASITLAADSSAFAISDADAEKIVGIVSVSVADMGNQRYGNAAPFLPYWCDATSLFFTMICRSAFAASLGDVRVNFNLELD